MSNYHEELLGLIDELKKLYPPRDDEERRQASRRGSRANAIADVVGLPRPYRPEDWGWNAGFLAVHSRVFGDGTPKALHHLRTCRERVQMASENAPEEIGMAEGGSTTPTEGEWSGPMSLTEIARRITGKHYARAREVRSLVERYGLVKVSPRKYRVRLDTMDPNTRRKLEATPS